MHSSIPIRRSQGFTLLEVLLAFVVFALSFAVVLEILSGSMRNTVRAREYTDVALIAQSVMDQVGLDIPLVAGTQASGDEGEFHWSLDVVEYAGGEEGARMLELSDLTGIVLVEVVFEITWGTGVRERTNRFSTVRAMLPDNGSGLNARVTGSQGAGK